MSATKRVAVVGAGVAGLQALKALRRVPGVSAQLFEAGKGVGGTWLDAYANAGLQVPKSLYEFPDYEMKGFKSNHVASAKEVHAYVKDYVRDNGLEDAISLNTRVQRIAANSTKTKNWEITTSDGKTTAFDDVVVATGIFCRPFIPAPYQQFRGKTSSAPATAKRVYHATEVSKEVLQQLKGKKVVVVGSAKSAQDMAEALSGLGGDTEVTMFFRRAHWGAPLKIAGVIPFQYIFLSRFGQALVSLSTGIWPDAAKASPTLASLSRSRAMAATVAPVFSIVEALFNVQLGYKGDFRPSPGIVRDFYGYAHLPSSGFVRAVKDGKIRMVKGDTEAVRPQEGGGFEIIATKNSAVPSLRCDAIICGTGYEKAHSEMFDASTLVKLAPETDGLHLYRQMVPPRVPHLYFCGSETASISNIATDFIQAKWIAAAVKDRAALLPSEEEMIANVESTKRWKRSWMPETPARAAMVLLHMTHYHDTLLRDLGVNPARKSNPLAEVLMPYTPADYRTL